MFVFFYAYQYYFLRYHYCARFGRDMRSKILLYRYAHVLSNTRGNYITTLCAGVYNNICAAYMYNNNILSRIIVRKQISLKKKFEQNKSVRVNADWTISR